MTKRQHVINKGWSTLFVSGQKLGAVGWGLGDPQEQPPRQIQTPGELEQLFCHDLPFTLITLVANSVTISAASPIMSDI